MNPAAQLAIFKQMSRQVLRGSGGEYQADERGRCRPALLASIRPMSGQVSRGSAGEYQTDERAGVARLSWR